MRSCSDRILSAGNINEEHWQLYLLHFSFFVLTVNWYPKHLTFRYCFAELSDNIIFVKIPLKLLFSNRLRWWKGLPCRYLFFYVLPLSEKFFFNLMDSRECILIDSCVYSILIMCVKIIHSINTSVQNQWLKNSRMRHDDYTIITCKHINYFIVL